MKMHKIYIVHGWAYTIEKWDPFVKALKDKGFEIELLRIPGLTAPLDEVWTLENYIEWLKKILHHEKDKVVLLGHSNGGRVILSYAKKYPEKIRQLILIDSAGIYHNESQVRFKRFVFGNLAKAGKNIFRADFFRKLLYRMTRESDYEKANPIMRKTMVNLITSDITDKLTQLNIPTVIIWGEEDKVTPLKDGKKMHEMIKGSKFFVISGAKHSPQFNYYNEIVKIITDNIIN